MVTTRSQQIQIASQLTGPGSPAVRPTKPAARPTKLALPAKAYKTQVKKKGPKPRLQPIPKSANVARPTSDHLPPDLPSLTARRSGTVLIAKAQAGYQRLVQKWAETTPTYIIPGIRLDRLRARPKSKKVKASVQEKMDAMGEWPCDPFSGIFEDMTGNRLVCVFASRKVGLCKLKSTEYQSGPKGHPGRTDDDLKTILPENLVHDGFPHSDLNRYLEVTQHLHAVLHPHSHERDGRHDEHERVIDLTLQTEDIRAPLHIPEDRGGREEYKPPPGCITSVEYMERVGVTHLVHGWEMQGHKGDFSVSKDFVRGTNSAGAVEWYFRSTSGMAERLSAMFQVAFPEYHKRYSQAFQAGVWTPSDPGPWLGRAIVWKLQVSLHRDGLDAGPAATFPMGSYKGGAMYFPDLGLKLSYKPGDVVISMAGDLYHSVEEWEPDLEAPQQSVTPGRVSHVFFFPQKSLEVLEGKKPEWAKNTCWGKNPDSRRYANHSKSKDKKREKNSAKGKGKQKAQDQKED